MTNLIESFVAKESFDEEMNFTTKIIALCASEDVSNRVAFGALMRVMTSMIEEFPLEELKVEFANVLPQLVALYRQKPNA